MAQEKTPEQLHARIKWGNGVTLGLLALLLLLVAGIGYYQYQQYLKYTNEKYLVRQAEQNIEEHYGEIRAALKKEIKASGPYLARKLKEKARESLPKGREQLEKFIMRNFDLAFREATEFSAAKFQAYVEDYDEDIRALYKEAKTLPAEARKHVVRLEEGVEKHFGVDVQEQAKTVLKFHDALNRRLDKLLNNQALNPEEMMERRLLRILRTLYLRDFENAKIAQR